MDLPRDDLAKSIGGFFKQAANVFIFKFLRMSDDGTAYVDDRALHPGDDEAIDVKKVEQRYAPFAQITTAITTVVKNTPGFLHGISINGGTLGAITIYDNVTATGTPKYTITPSAGLLLPQFLPINCVFDVGITIVTAAATVITPVGR